jgi:hypothetical protein
MVFANRRSALCDGSEILTILHDDGYTIVVDRNNIHVGDVVLYRSKPQGEVHHVGIVSDINLDISTGYRHFEVLSKWGEYGEYFHKENVVPQLFGNLREYWSERKVAGA